MTKQIPLTQGQIAIVDDEDFERVSAYNWRAAWNKNTGSYYAIKNTTSAKGKRTTTCMHRFILGVSERRQKIDHIDHDTLFNVRRNLRVCTSSQNQHSQKKRVGCSSQYKGVCWDKSNCKWNARIMNSNHKFLLGNFKDEEDAARSYDVKARELFGEFAYLNFPA
jgi:AP2 domain